MCYIYPSTNHGIHEWINNTWIWDIHHLFFFFISGGTFVYWKFIMTGQRNICWFCTCMENLDKIFFRYTFWFKNNLTLVLSLLIVMPMILLVIPQSFISNLELNMCLISTIFFILCHARNMSSTYKRKDDLAIFSFIIQTIIKIAPYKTNTSHKSVKFLIPLSWTLLQTI